MFAGARETPLPIKVFLHGLTPEDKKKDLTFLINSKYRATASPVEIG